MSRRDINICRVITITGNSASHEELLSWENIGGEKNILVVMATAKFKTQKEKGRFLHRSIHNGHFNKSHSFSSHAQTTIKHFQPLPLEEPCLLALPKWLWDAGLFPFHLSCCVLSLSYLGIVYSDSIFIAMWQMPRLGSWYLCRSLRLCCMQHVEHLSAFLLLTAGEKARSPNTAHHGSCCPLSTWILTSFSLSLK